MEKTAEIVENTLLKRTLFSGMIVLPVLFMVLTYYKLQPGWTSPSTRTIFTLGALLLAYMATRIVRQLSSLNAIKAVIHPDKVVIWSGPNLWGRGNWTETDTIRLDGQTKLAGRRWNIIFNGCLIIATKKDSWFLPSSWFKGVNSALAFMDEKKIRWETLRGGEVKKFRATLRKMHSHPAKR